MAKTITFYEASDIDLKDDDLHKNVYGGLVVAALLISAPAKEGEGKEERLDRQGKSAVATMLNVLTQSGYDIVKREDIPSAFFSGPSTPGA